MPPIARVEVAITGFSLLDVYELGPDHEKVKGGAPPFTFENKSIGSPTHTALPTPDGEALKVSGASVLQEISSNPKSFPPAAVCKSTIEIVTAVVEPEFHVP